MLSGVFSRFKLLWFIILSTCSLGIYFYIGYGINRHEHLALGLCVTSLFVIYIVLFQYEFPKSSLIGLGLISRIIFLWATPSLSQDFYRFLWDAKLILEGLNPYLWTPKELLDFNCFNTEIMRSLWQGMGTLSQNNFSNYPPVHQLPSVAAKLIGGHSISLAIVVLRTVLIGADIGVVIVGQKLLKLLNLPKKYILLYFLNPLVVIELSGNLHHEGVMIFGLALALYFAYRREEIRAGVFMGLSVLTKLTPILLIPLLLHKIKLKKNYRFYATIALVIILGFAPFFSVKFSGNYLQTIGLWFTNFEFNSSFFWLAKLLLNNIFQLHLMPYMRFAVPGLMGLFLLFFHYKKETNFTKILTQMMILLTGYFLISTTVHPWYVVTLVFLSCFTPFRFPIVWSFTIFFSYFSYQNGYVEESHFWRLIQYGVVVGIWGYEFYKINRITTSSAD